MNELIKENGEVIGFCKHRNGTLLYRYVVEGTKVKYVENSYYETSTGALTFSTRAKAISWIHKNK